MGLFKKKPDPISERATDLTAQIAALEAQIKELARQEVLPPAPSATSPASVTPPEAVSGQPRLRSTTRPRGLHTPAASVPSRPIFEPVEQPHLHPLGQDPTTPPPPDLGTRKFDLASLWQRVRNHFRGPSTSNPKLVSYLAAGSIQGLRPLRYEKRVARNRALALIAALVLALWGIVAIFLRSR